LSRRRAIALGIGLTTAAFLGVPDPRDAAAMSKRDAADDNAQPVSVAMPDFLGVGLPEAGDARDVTRTIGSNLQRSGQFVLMDQSRYPSKKYVHPDALPDFPYWSTLNVQVLIVGRLTLQSGEHLRAEVRLWDIPAAQHLSGRMFASTWNRQHLLAHVISDAIYERLTGARGNFESSASETAQP
jgi:TolB protein